MEVFGKFGYDGATTRQIARTAGVNLAAIPYYFGGKEDLYRATIQWIVDSIREGVMKDICQDHEAVDCDSLNDDELIDVAVRHVLAFACFIERKDSAAIKLIMAREQILPTAAFSIVHQALGDPLFRILRQILGRLMRRSADDPEVIIRVHALVSQATFFTVGRASLQFNLHVETLQREHIDIITRVIEQNTRAVLHQWTQQN